VLRDPDGRKVQREIGGLLRNAHEGVRMRAQVDTQRRGAAFRCAYNEEVGQGHRLLERGNAVGFTCSRERTNVRPHTFHATLPSAVETAAPINPNIGISATLNTTFNTAASVMNHEAWRS